VQRFLFVFLT